jgi:hypothetical protein
MYIRAILKEPDTVIEIPKNNTVVYINTDRYDRFVIDKDQVEAVGIDNLSLYLQKTKELKDQLDILITQASSKGFENFK